MLTGGGKGFDVVTSEPGRIERHFPTIGNDNDRLVPWRSALTLFQGLLIFLSAISVALHAVGVSDDWSAPSLAGVLTIRELCGSRKDGSRIRNLWAAVATAAILWTACGAIGVRIFPAGSHSHPGILGFAIYTVATFVAVCGFTIVNRLGGGAQPGLRPPRSAESADQLR